MEKRRRIRKEKKGDTERDKTTLRRALHSHPPAGKSGFDGIFKS